MARRKKITVQTDNSNWQAPKKRKPRKPMSEEQRVAAAARLEKAREKRKEKNPDYGQSGVAICLLYTSPSPRDGLLSRMPSSA